jgi:hypothetical protein
MVVFIVLLRHFASFSLLRILELFELEIACLMRSIFTVSHKCKNTLVLIAGDVSEVFPVR